MRKIGGVALLAVLAFSSVPAASAAPTQLWISKTGETVNIADVRFTASAVTAFKSAAADVPLYGALSEENLAVIGRDLCEHYAGGFTTDDLRASNGNALAALGEAAKSTVCR